MKKSILVLGAAPSCVGIIKTIKRMGHLAIVVGNSASLPGIEFADKYLIADDNDVDAVVEYCKSIGGVDAIVPTPVDRPLIWMAKVAEILGLVFLSVESAMNFRHKFLMKKCLESANVPCAKGVLLDRDQFSLSTIGEFSYPIIVKPIDGYASRGVLKVDDSDQLLQFINEASSFSSNGQFIIEEFIDGREFNAEGVCFNGNVEIYAIVEKVRDSFPRTVEMGHIVPPDINSVEEIVIVETVTSAVLALGMKNGAFNAEIKIKDEKGIIIEVNGRLAGDFIVSHLLKPTTGQDMEEAVVNIALGIKPPPAERKYIRHGMISFFNLSPNKKINKITDYSSLYDDPHLIWAFIFFQEGEIIPEVLHMGHRSGFVIVTANNREELFLHTTSVKESLISRIELV